MYLGTHNAVSLLISVLHSAYAIFGKIVQYYAYFDFKKILLQPVGKYFIVCALLTNCHTCLYGSTTSDFFGVQPSSLELICQTVDLIVIINF